MTHVGHLFDASTGWEQRVGICQWLEHAPSDRYSNSLAILEPGAKAALGRVNAPVEVLPPCRGLCVLSAPAVSRFVSRREIEVIHAWGIHAALAARIATKVPVVLQIFDPLIAARSVRILRILARSMRLAVVCGSGIVRRRLVDGGLPPAVTVVIRPGVDFGLINAVRRRSLREELRVAAKEHVVILPERASRAGGQFDGFWAGTIYAHLCGGARVIVPGNSPEQRRIARFARNLPVPPRVIMPGGQYPFERLLALSDVLLVTPPGDVSTTAIAWAMGARVAVVATHGDSVAELIVDNVNGLLVKATSRKTMAGELVRILRDRAAQERVREAAYEQAYQAFSVRRSVEQYMRLYRNVIEGAPPAGGIIDSVRPCQTQALAGAGILAD